MKKTPLFERHLEADARMAPFAGYDMPISYKGINEEHHAVRNNVGLFDVSHMGEFIVKGKEALLLVNELTSNDASVLAPGDIQYSCFPNNNGGIIDDLLVYRLFDDQCSEGEQAFMLVVNASNIEKDFNWVKKHNHFDTRLIDISGKTALLALQGPKAIELLQELTDVDLAQIKYYTFKKGTVAGIQNVVVSATGYTGAGGFELYVEENNALALWDIIVEKGQKYNLQLAGLGCRDTLRLEMGYCLYGNDIDDTTSPLEAGLGWITKLNKEYFIQKNYLLQQKEEGVSRKLVGFVLEDRRVPRHDYPIQNLNGESIGKVTSGTMSPSLNYPIGMGYINSSEAKAGNIIQIRMGNKWLPAKIVKLPFWNKKIDAK
jgi:aminomethyltransferase